jgi:hypothetical protein
VTFLHQGSGQFDHGVDVVGGVRLDSRGQRIQLGHVFPVLGGELLSDRLDAPLTLLCGGDDLVVHVGDVARVDHLVEVRLQQPKQGIEHHHRTGIADVRQVVDRGPTHVHGDGIRHQRFEFLLGGTHGVVQLQRHWGYS